MKRLLHIPSTWLAQVNIFAKSDIGFAIILTLCWQIILTAVGYLIDFNFHPPSDAFLDPNNLFRHTLHWDAGWYEKIIQSNFYQNPPSEGAIFAFYPLYPLLVALLSAVTLNTLPLPLASVAITTIATIAILTALIKISAHLIGSRHAAILVAILFITSPAAMFLHVFYSEAIFIAIGAWAYLLAIQKQWRAMAILLAVLTAARLPSVLFIALCGLEFLRIHEWKLSNALRDRSWLWFLLAPLGFISYSIWCYIVIGDPLAMFHAYTAPDGWPYQVFNPNILSTLYDASRELYHSVNAHGINQVTLVNSILPLGSLAILSCVAFYAMFTLKGKFLPLGVFGLLSLIMFTLNSNIVSVHRYTLACLSIFILVVMFFRQHTRVRWLLYVAIPLCFAIQLQLLELFVTNNFAG